MRASGGFRARDRHSITKRDRALAQNAAGDAGAPIRLQRNAKTLGEDIHHMARHVLLGDFEQHRTDRELRADALEAAQAVNQKIGAARRPRQFAAEIRTGGLPILAEDQRHIAVVRRAAKIAFDASGQRYGGALQRFHWKARLGAAGDADQLATHTVITSSGAALS